MHLLVVNADDFGYSDERDAGIVECYRKGHISSVSLLVNGVSAENAVKLAKQYDIPTGLHLNLTEGNPIGKQQYRTLTGPDGYFLGMFGMREAAGRRDISMAEVKVEIQAQIDRFKELFGSPPFHTDGHQHVHCMPEICEVFATVLQQNDIKATRLPIEVDIMDHPWSSPPLAGFMEEVVHQAKHAKDVYTRNKLWTPDQFVGLKTMGADMTLERLQTYLCGVFKTAKKVESCELMVHPGNRTKEIGGCGDGPDDFSKSSDREYEMSILGSSGLADIYNSLHVKLVSFKECMELAS